MSSSSKEDFPLATIAWYGPDDQRATKVAVAVFTEPESDPVVLRRWFCETGDVRNDATITEQIIEFLKEHGVVRTAMAGGILGCPHQEGIDYPKGGICPECSFWWGRDRSAIERMSGGAPKAGRNDPCPCGSGKKFKKCCGNSAV
jgi:hypothetical protein